MRRGCGLGNRRIIECSTGESREYPVMHHKFVPTLFALIAFGLIALLSGCSSMKGFEVSPNYPKTKYAKVGVLVTRMGHFHSSKLTRISADTDYAVRKPTYQADAIAPQYQDVYIESDERIRQSLPDYPKYVSEGGPIEDERYFGNITPQILEVCTALFRGRGQGVVDVREAAKPWDHPLPESKIGKILQNLRGTVDALFVLHYMDVGYLSASDIEQKGEYRGGLVRLDDSIAMFDVATGERVLYRDARPLLVASRLAHDEKIVNDPKFKGRIAGKDTDTSDGRYQSRLSSNEMIDIAMQYLRDDLAESIP
jgi:hypothetical protein